MDLYQPIYLFVLLVAIGVSFFVSASAGLGGSLVLVPALIIALGPKEGVSLAALLLAANNIVKLWAYRHSLPVRQALLVAVCTIIGAAAGARWLVAAPEWLVNVAVAASFAIALAAEQGQTPSWRTPLAPFFAIAAGATSGFSGTSGPLKGVAVRSLALDRMHTVGAAAIVSAAGDFTKTVVFSEAGLLDGRALLFAAISLPLMIGATFVGRRCTVTIGERGYAGLFWLVMSGYTVRLLLPWAR